MSWSPRRSATKASSWSAGARSRSGRRRCRRACASDTRTSSRSSPSHPRWPATSWSAPCSWPAGPSAGRWPASRSSAASTTSTSARSRRGPSSTRAWSPRRCCPSSIRTLQDPAFVSPFAVLHRRFSTNTAPKWSLAQPMRLLAHNGEINTLLGNLAWMRAREPELAAPVWGARIAELLPAVHGDSSDSGALDKLVELLVRSGRSPLEALMMTMPAAYEQAAAEAGTAGSTALPGAAPAEASPTRASSTSTTTTPACWRRGTGRRSSPSPTAATSAPASTATACARRATRAPAPACSRSPRRPAPSTCPARRSSRRAGSAPAR